MTKTDQVSRPPRDTVQTKKMEPGEREERVDKSDDRCYFVIMGLPAPCNQRNWRARHTKRAEVSTLKVNVTCTYRGGWGSSLAGRGLGYATENKGRALLAGGQVLVCGLRRQTAPSMSESTSLPSSRSPQILQIRGGNGAFVLGRSTPTRSGTPAGTRALGFKAGKETPGRPVKTNQEAAAFDDGLACLGLAPPRRNAPKHQQRRRPWPCCQ